jgi:Lon protease-like protein
MSIEKTIPIFPLELVAFPGEALNLHIFEPRYRQLIADCEDSGEPFGVPAVVNRRIGPLGTLVELVEITERYDDGQLDIRTRGLKVFEITEIVRQLPDKLYSGARVNFPANDRRGGGAELPALLASVRELLALLKVKKNFPRPDAELTAYDLAHLAGLSPEDNYALLGLFRERERVAWLQRHLNKIIPVVRDLEALKERVQLNGHFKPIPGFEL